MRCEPSPVLRWMAVLLCLTAAAVGQEGRPVYFVRDVAPILDREGCSTGACHGKFGGGQGRLAVSLMTLDPITDHAKLEPVVNLDNPKASLLLQKPTMEVEHGGGKRFKVDSDEYNTILRWIEEGVRNPDREPLPVDIEVKPERFIFGPDSQKGDLEVIGHFADGSTEDVTNRTVFITQDDAVATVTSKGHVRARRWGVTAVMCRYVGITKPCFISMPRPDGDADPAPPPTEAKSIIDSTVLANLKWLNINPAPRSDDYAFLRRIYLDLAGALPKPDEIAAFLADPAADKRSKLIDKLLDDDRFVSLRTLRLGDMLRVNPQKLANGPLQNRAAIVFDTWIRDQVRNNEPYDRFARDLITAEGSAMLSGPANFYRVERSPEDRAETVGQAFLGTRLACARCHNHPFDRWKTDDYWNFAAFFAKVREDRGELFNEAVMVHDQNRTLKNQSVTSPNKGKTAIPTFLGGPALEGDPKKFKGDYIGELADWMFAPDNPYFAQAAVNRIWSHLMGRGIIDPVDDMRETSVPTVPSLLHMLGMQFRNSGYDVRALVRTICNSYTYQMASSSDPTNSLDSKFFSHYQPKQMLPQVLQDAINDACGTADRYGTYPVGTTAVDLPLMVRNDFLDRFGRSDRQFLAVLDPHVEPTLPQALHMINSSYINNKVSAGNGTVATLEKQLSDNDQLIDALYLRTLCRPPTDVERAKVDDYVKQVGNRREAFEDLLWALLTSREFLFIS